MGIMEDLNCWEEKFEVCNYAARLLDQITSLNKLVQYPIDLRDIKKGIYYAQKYHGFKCGNQVSLITPIR